MGGDNSETEVDLQATFSTNMLCEIVSFLQKQETFYDFTVSVDESEIKCNSFILKACSEYFRCLFDVDMLESRCNKLTLIDISKDTFQTLWEMLLTRKVCINLDNVVPLWYAADKLQMSLVFKVCEDYLAQEITDDNFCEMYCHARKLGSSKIIKSCCSFMERHFTSFCKSDLFLTLQFEEIERLVEERSQNAHTENQLEQVIDAILRWAETTQDSAVTGITSSTFDDNTKESYSNISDVPETQSDINLEHPSSSKVLEHPSSSEVLEHPSCTKVSEHPSGTEVSEHPSGTEVSEHPSGTKVSEYPSCTELQFASDQADLKKQSHKDVSCRNSGDQKSSSDPSNHSSLTIDRRLDHSSNRVKYLAKLLQATRLNFISVDCLMSIISRVTLLGDKDTLETVKNELKHQLSSNIQSMLEPPSDTMERGMAYAEVSKGTCSMIFIQFVSFSTAHTREVSSYNVQMSWHHIRKFNKHGIRPLVAGLRDEFFIYFNIEAPTNSCFQSSGCREEYDTLFRCGYQSRKWESDSKSFDDHKLCALMATKSGNVYGVSRVDHSVLLLKPWASSSSWERTGKLCSDQGSIANVIDMGEKLVVFYHGYPSAAIEVFCLQQKSSHLLEVKETSLDDRHVTFTYQNETFLLHNNGALYKLIDKEYTVHVELVSKLWPSDIAIQVYGADVDKETLFVLAMDLSTDDRDQWTRLPQLVSKLPLRLRVIKLDKELKGRVSQFLPMAINQFVGSGQ